MRNTPRSAAEVIEAFWDNVNPEPMSGCWLWLASCSKSGYGKMKIAKKNYRAHRASWTLFRGEVPRALLVCHKCDTRSCVNPDHLFLGTSHDNNVDMIRKGRMSHRSCDRHPDSKLTVDQVVKIRDLSKSVSCSKLSRDFGVSFPAIKNIVLRKKWKSI